MPQLPANAPSYTPPGYRLQRVTEANYPPALGGPAEVTAWYTRGSGIDDARYPLLIHFAGPGAMPLVGTDGHSGQPVDLAIAGAETTYHDGWWTTGPGPESRELGSATLHWDTTAMHSLTISTSAGRVAIRGAKTRGVSFIELMSIAKSLNIKG